MILLILLSLCAIAMMHFDASPETIYVLHRIKAGGATFTLQFCTRQFTLGVGVNFEFGEVLFIHAGPFCLCVQYDRADYGYEHMVPTGAGV